MQVSRVLPSHRRFIEASLVKNLEEKEISLALMLPLQESLTDCKYISREKISGAYDLRFIVTMMKSIFDIVDGFTVNEKIVWMPWR